MARCLFFYFKLKEMKYLNLLFLLIFLIATQSCKTTEQQQISETEVKDDTQNDTHFPNVSKAPAPTKIDRAVVEEVKQSILSDTIFASIQRTPCYGRCPIYEAIIYNSGFVVYKGVLNVDKIGTYTSRLNGRQIEEIKRKATEINYFDMETQYDSPVTDLPTTITSLKLGNLKKKIKNRVGGPVTLKEYETVIENILSSLSWIKKSDSYE